ncbi:MAG: AbrB/MazE/SpoVT family DNA-binding domain-containing protein, partial [Chloroflexi bacterium]|nr:AbrB/MazE/SpoVT family DNA-binding domain-containing protein [Chloroflexota bacterium]
MSAFSVRVQAKGQVTIPKTVRKKLNLTKGDLVVFVETE